MANTKTIMYKLQKALQMHGVIVTISTNEFYSEEQERFIKCYNVKHGKNIIAKTCSQIEVIDALTKLLNDERGVGDDRREKGDSKAADTD